MTSQLSTQAQSQTTDLNQTPAELVGVLASQAKQASYILAQATDAQINAVLTTLAALLRNQDNAAQIIQANAKDLEAGRAKGLSEALLDRLLLNADRLEGMAGGIETVASLTDPLGKVQWEETRPNDLKIQRVSVPIGVLGMIYESRPNVTIDAAALCLKSRNAVILRGGSESLQSSLALHGLIQRALDQHNLPAPSVAMIPNADRACVGAMLTCHEHIDVMIPRGGRSLIERVMNEARMPVFGHLEGLCHIYIHPSVKPEIATSVPLNAKMRRTGICGAVETLLLDAQLDQTLSREIVQGLLNQGCELVGDEAARKLNPSIGQATDEDWVTEYLAPRLSIKTVSSVQAAIDHINTFGSHHTDSILAEDAQAATAFLNQVDSGIVMHNVSTQFADGGEFGMGAEIGIATGKMHARGPVGVEQLCTYKYHVLGSGQTRS